MWSTVEEVEERVGAQVRALRLRANRTVDEVASEAGVSPKTVQNLEMGRGSTLGTLTRVLRALRVDGWLDTLAPPEPISPIAVLEASRARPAVRKRASPRRS